MFSVSFGLTRLALASKPSHWINDRIRCLKRSYRKPECFWRDTYLKYLSDNFNSCVRDERALHFYNLISKSKVSISDIVTSSPSAFPMFSNEDCEELLAFFCAKSQNFEGLPQLVHCLSLDQFGH